MPHGEEDSSIEFPLALRFGEDDERKALTAKDIGYGGGRREEGGGEWRVGESAVGKGEKKIGVKVCGVSFFYYKRLVIVQDYFEWSRW